MEYITVCQGVTIEHVSAGDLTALQPVNERDPVANQLDVYRRQKITAEPTYAAQPGVYLF